MNNIILEVKNLTKVFDNKIKAINNISLEFEAGKFYALLGENGAGKSTFMRLLMQNDFPTQGKIYYQGLSIYNINCELPYESLYLDESMPLALNKPLETWANIFSNTYPSFDMSIFERLTHLLRVDSTAPIFSFSRGQKAKALFALGAARKPKLYFLDEITAVLDIGSRMNMVKFLEEEISQRNCSVVMSSNIATELPTKNTHLFIIKNGEIALNCSASDLSSIFVKYMSPSDEMSHQLLASGGILLSENSNGTKSFILLKDHIHNHSLDITEDQRHISVGDVMTYYTSSKDITL